MKRLSQKKCLLLLTPLLISLVACNAVPVKNSSDEPVPNNQKEEVKGDDIVSTAVKIQPAGGETARASDLSEDLLYNLLAGEFAGVRGKMDQSIDFYAQAAKLSDDPRVITRAAYIALYAQEYEQAIALTNHWQQLNQPQNDMVERIRFIAFLHLEYLAPSVQTLETMLLKEKSINRKLIPLVTNILSKESTPEFARKVASRLNKNHPNQTFFLLLLAKFEANLGELDAALQHINELVKIDDSLADAYLIKAQIYAGMGEHEKAIDEIATAVKKRPHDNRLRLQYSRMLVQMKQFERALVNFEILKQSMPNDENVLLSLGLLSIETDRNNQAKEYLQALLDNGYHNQQAHYYLGRIQQNNGEIMAAIANYERVLDGDYWLDSRLRAAGLVAKTGNTEAALLKLETVINQDDSDKTRIQVCLAKGEVLGSVSRHKEAYSLYNNALQKSPENTDLLYARALTAEKLDLLDVTESDLKMVIMHEPENASALNALGYTLADRTERLNEAQEYILKAAQLLPDDPAILDSLGWVYYRLGQYENAIKWLSKAFENLKDAEIAAHLGEVLWMDGQTQKANNIWRKGKKLDGNQTVLRDTMERLKQ
jgi:tetratricopeptide (TPR) repeat protein